MKVRIKRIDKSLPLPKYESEGAVACDLYCREDMTIPAKSVARIPTNVIIEIPKGYMLYLKDRSSTVKNKGLLATAGIFDLDYHGPEDEIKFQVLNYTDKDVKVDKGERLCQVLFVKINTAEWQEVEKDMKTESRGGFGSTGTHI